MNVKEFIEQNLYFSAHWDYELCARGKYTVSPNQFWCKYHIDLRKINYFSPITLTENEISFYISFSGDSLLFSFEVSDNKDLNKIYENQLNGILYRLIDLWNKFNSNVKLTSDEYYNNHKISDKWRNVL